RGLPGGADVAGLRRRHLGDDVLPRPRREGPGVGVGERDGGPPGAPGAARGAARRLRRRVQGPVARVLPRPGARHDPAVPAGLRRRTAGLSPPADVRAGREGVFAPRLVAQLLRQPLARWPATQAATWVRRCRPIFDSSEVMWFFTVFSATPSRSPVSRFD